MLNKTFTLESETGLHARPATELAKIAMKYPCLLYTSPSPRDA